MKIQKNTLILIVFAIFLLVQPGLAEKLSIRLTFNTNSINGNDINPWIEATNTYWQDRQNSQGGSLQGELVPISYGGSFEVEIRIPLYKGLALNLAGSRYSSSEEGNVTWERADGYAYIKQFISNSVTALPIKIGLSYVFPIPAFERLSLVGGLGRHILFVSYDSINNGEEYEYFNSFLDYELTQRRDGEYTYNSEKLGFYANLGAEFEVAKFFAVLVELEKVWNTVDGFKGNFEYDDFYDFDGEIVDPDPEKVDVTLYYYDKYSERLADFYSTLEGLDAQPENPHKSVRRGELDFNNFSFKIGFRFKF